jgi:hypothetical protein
VARKRNQQEKNASSRRLRSASRRSPRTATEFFAKPERQRATLESVASAITDMRSKRFSLARAAKENGLDPRTVKRWGATALRKDKAGRYVAKASDRLLRAMEVLVPADGRREFALRDSREASKIGGHWSAIQLYLSTGDASALKQFEGVRMTDADGRRVPLLTDTGEIDRLGHAGELSFETIYAK